MKVVLPSDTSHSITFIPRYYPTGAISLTLINEVTKVETVVPNANSTLDGITTIDFDFTFKERDKYNMKVTEGTNIVYRGDIFATEQTPQDFDITKGYITYS